MPTPPESVYISTMRLDLWKENYKKLLAEKWHNHTAGEIVKMLSNMGFQTSRNAVMGQVARLNLRKEKVYKAKPKKKPKKELKPAQSCIGKPTGRPKNPIYTELPCFNETRPGIPLERTNETHCLWPIRHSVSCGEKRDGPRYCHYHNEISRRGYVAVTQDNP